MASCRGGILQERRGLQPWTDPLNQSGFARRREGGRAGPCAPTTGPGNRQHASVVKPRILVGSTKKSHTAHICSGHREGGEIALNSLGVSVQYGAHSSPTHFFFVCQSAYLNSFQGGKPGVVCPQTPAGGPRSTGNTVAAQDGAPAAAPSHKRLQWRVQTPLERPLHFYSSLNPHNHSLPPRKHLRRRTYAPMQGQQPDLWTMESVL